MTYSEDIFVEQASPFQVPRLGDGQGRSVYATIH